MRTIVIMFLHYAAGHLKVLHADDKNWLNIFYQVYNYQLYMVSYVLYNYSNLIHKLKIHKYMHVLAILCSCKWISSRMSGETHIESQHLAL